MPVTSEDGWSGLSGELSDVRKKPRLVAWSALMREVVIHSKGEGENSELKQRVWCLEEDTEACHAVVRVIFGARGVQN